MSTDNETQYELNWLEVDAAPFRLSGFAWHEQDGAFHRLPLSASPNVRPDIELLAGQTAGGQVAFRSNSRKVAVKVDLKGPSNMDHMPATGQCGCDLYVGDPHQQHFQSVVRYDRAQDHYESSLFEHPDPEMRSFTINLPLYEGIKSIQVGLAPDADIAAPPPWADPGRIVIYGTSIVQGGCASRPGMAHTNILSRTLNMEFINLGFSGNGNGEASVIELVAAVPRATLIILDYEANSWIEGLQKSMPAAIDIIRKQRPETHILVLSRIPFSKDLTHNGDVIHREQCRDYQAQVVDKRQRAGDANISFLDGTTLLDSPSFECTVDGVHPSDLGFQQMADRMEPAIRAILSDLN